MKDRGDSQRAAEEEVSEAALKGALGVSGEVAQVATPDEELSKRLAETEDKYLRLYAEFENHKKRMAKDREEIRLGSQERLLRELLEVKDHLELALDHAKQATGTGQTEGLKEGVSLTLRQMNQFLEKTGVVELKSLGKVFDPAQHEAIGQTESDSPAGTVVQEFQKGYLFYDRLLRPARVMVSKEKS